MYDSPSVLSLGLHGLTSLVQDTSSVGGESRVSHKYIDRDSRSAGHVPHPMSLPWFVCSRDESVSSIRDRGRDREKKVRTFSRPWEVSVPQGDRVCSLSPDCISYSETVVYHGSSVTRTEITSFLGVRDNPFNTQVPCWVSVCLRFRR